MLVAVDQNGERVYAENDGKITNCFCPVCSEKLTHKKGKVRRPYFAHKTNSNCVYDKDSKSEWHIRMQEYFPKENREVRFVEEKTGEIHIADVFLAEAETVLEFQHSPISWEEFWGRTRFHITNGRRIVWLFDESSRSEKDFGRFRKDDLEHEQWLYNDRCFKWLRKPRKILASPPQEIEPLLRNLSICVYTGAEGDIFHRIIKQYYGFEYVTFSLHDIQMEQEINPDEFFYPEDYWLSQDPWKEKIAAYNSAPQRVANNQKMIQIQLPIKRNIRRRRYGRF